MAKKPAPAFDIPADDVDPPEAPAAEPAPVAASVANPMPRVEPEALALEPPTKPERAGQSPYKVGKRNLSVYIPEAAHRQIKALAAEDGIKLQDYLCTLLNREFVRRGKEPLA